MNLLWPYLHAWVTDVSSPTTQNLHFALVMFSIEIEKHEMLPNKWLVLAAPPTFGHLGEGLSTRRPADVLLLHPEAITSKKSIAHV